MGSNAMTTNAMLTYLAAALAFPGAVFLFLGSRRPRKDLEVLPARRANTVIGALLCAAGAAAELISLAHGGPAVGERSGNIAGGIVAIALVTVCCLMVCVIAQQLILGYFRRNRRTLRRGYARIVKT